MLRDLVVYTTFHLTGKQTPHSHKQHNRNENFGYMTSNESIDFCVSHTQHKRVKKIQQGAFMKEIFSVNSGARVAKKILFEKKKEKQSMSWAESTGIERQRIKVSRHLFLTEVTYVCHHLITGFLKGA